MVANLLFALAMAMFGLVCFQDGLKTRSFKGTLEGVGFMLAASIITYIA